MNVYVAGSSQELDRVEAVVDAVRAHGHTITFDWTLDVRASAKRGVSDGNLTDPQAERFAMQDVLAVDAAQLTLLLAPTTQSRGAWFELGVAYARLSVPPHAALRHVLVSGPAARSCIFTRLPGIAVFDTDAAALDVIGRLR